jgi:hypothetical protein
MSKVSDSIEKYLAEARTKVPGDSPLWLLGFDAEQNTWAIAPDDETAEQIVAKVKTAVESLGRGRLRQWLADHNSGELRLHIEETRAYSQVADLDQLLNYVFSGVVVHPRSRFNPFYDSRAEYLGWWLTATAMAKRPWARNPHLPDYFPRGRADDGTGPKRPQPTPPPEVGAQRGPLTETTSRLNAGEFARPGNRIAEQMNRLPVDATPPAISSKEVLDGLGQVQHQLEQIQRPVAQRFAGWLKSLEGKDFGYDENKAIVGVIQNTLNRLGLAIKCPQNGCGVPARLRSKRPGRSKAGVIQFDHFVDRDGSRIKTTHGGGSSFPLLALVWPDGSPVQQDSSTESQIVSAG